jgi:hypothetical protein
MKRFILCLLFALAISLSSYSQIIKTFSGPFYKGKATYQYFENEQYERIYHGKFAYIEGDSLNREISSYYLNGSFLNDKRNGKWIIIAFYSGENYFAKEKLTLNYSNGILNGKFTKIYNDYHNKNNVVKLSGNFKGNIINGVVNWIEVNNSGSKSIKCFFDKDGFMDSTFYFKGGNMELNSLFKNGFQIKCLYRNLSTGKVLRNFDYTKFYNAFSQNYDTLRKYAFIKRYAFYKKEPFPGFGYGRTIRSAKEDEDFIIDNDSIIVTDEKYIVQNYGFKTYDFYNEYYTYYSFIIVLKLLKPLDIFDTYFLYNNLYAMIDKIDKKGNVEIDIIPFKVILVEQK